MTRFVAVCLLVAACANANAPRLGASDAQTDAPADAAIDAKPDAKPIDACAPMTEICNGVDDDCDGNIDEGFPNKGMTCGGGVGACAVMGHYQCTADGSGTECSVTEGMPTMELCNNIDDDCDGKVDENWPNKGMACAVGVGACEANGLFVCSANGATTQCSATAGMPTNELCNGIDDDCDGSIDEDFTTLGQACTVGLGACLRTGDNICNTAQTGVACSATPGQPSQEICGNGIDEDCNGADAVCPSNDLPAGAIDISAGGTWTVDLSAAHDDNWAPSTSTLDCGNQGGRDVFYQFTLPAEEVVYYDSFGSNFDTVLRVFDGACTAIGTTLACADDECASTRSQGASDLQAGTYCLVVDQFSSATTAGAAVLHFLRGGRPGVALPNLNGSVTGTTAGKTNLSTASCQANSLRPDVGNFFLSCPNTTYTVDASTCNTAWDTILYIRSGNANSADVACNDSVPGCGPNGFAADIEGASVSGANLQWIIIDGFGNTGQGNYQLDYTIQ